MGKATGKRSQRRMVILTEGQLNIWRAKTAVSVIRYRPDEVACVLDSKAAGRNLKELVGVGADVPIVATLKEALGYKPNTLMIGIAPVGGKLPAAWLKTIADAMKAGLDVISGLHTFLNDDPKLASIAKQYKRTIWDVRVPPPDLDCSLNIAKDTKCKRVLAVGSDCNLGKMSVMLEMTKEAKARGYDAEFVATGQTGIIIEGSGIPMDRTISDFTNGAAERLVLERKHREILFVEGQGAIGHPAYSAVTMGLLHGTAPDAMVLCHCPTRKVTNNVPTPIPSLPFLIDLHEKLAGLLCPSKVVAVALNTFEMTPAAAKREVEKTEKLTGLPCTDVYRFGRVDKLMDALEKHYRIKKRKKKK
ncbi:MAG: DUF1611 domain-containing protein [Planctomycetes bacterium]|nr:DUF1611 domain-containing protein [Planctomycetota bacterium]